MLEQFPIDAQNAYKNYYNEVASKGFITQIM
jgi:hypothetical protein